MNLTNDDEPPDRPREIYCAKCGRRLMALRQPRCNWCGAFVPAADYARIQEQSRHVLALPDPTPLPTVTSTMQQWEMRGWRRTSPWEGFLPRQVRTFQPMTLGQKRLRTAVVVLFGILALVEIAHHVYEIWVIHRMLQTMVH